MIGATKGAPFCLKRLKLSSQVFCHCQGRVTSASGVAKSGVAMALQALGLADMLVKWGCFYILGVCLGMSGYMGGMSNELTSQCLYGND